MFDNILWFCTITLYPHMTHYVTMHWDFVQLHCNNMVPFYGYTPKLASLISQWASIGSDNTLRPRQDGRHFPDDIFKRIFLNENIRISIQISLKFVSNGIINNIPALVHIMAWRRTGDKPLFEPMIVSLPTHICVTRPQWVNASAPNRRQAIIWTIDDLVYYAYIRHSASVG